MDLNRFDALARHAAESRSRRGAVGLAVTGIAGALGIGPAEAKKRKGKSKKNEPKLNAFGCLNVGQKCNGNDGQCCSGICQGKKPTKGKKDRSQCVAHDTGGCQAGQDFCAAIESIPCGTGGDCFRTTGDASFCGNEEASNCVVCAKDKDCEPVFGPGAACVVCSDCDDETGGTGCISAAS